MSRLFLWRIICFLVLVGITLQCFGFFMPFDVTVDPVTHTTVQTLSYWIIFSRFIAASIFFPSPFWLICCFCGLASVLVPFITAFAALFKGILRSSFNSSIVGLVFATIGFLAYIFLVIFSFLADSVCMGNECRLYDVAGPGLWPTSLGYLISIGCFIVLLILGRNVRPSKLSIQ